MTDKKHLRIAIAGAAGRMGRALVEQLGAAAAQPGDNGPAVRLSLAFEHSGSVYLGQDSGEVARQQANNIPITDQLDPGEFDVLIDFTNPDATLEHLQACDAAERPMVIGTTGMGDRIADLEDAAARIPICVDANYSIGVNVVLGLLGDMAGGRLSGDFGRSADIEIVESHHRHKMDAPSGTALRMGRELADALGRDFDKVAVYDRRDGGQRQKHQIGIHSIRGGSMIGEHRIIFAAEHEQIEIVHRATNRQPYAQGAIQAAIWLNNGRSPGLYDMRRVTAEGG